MWISPFSTGGLHCRLFNTNGRLLLDAFLLQQNSPSYSLDLTPDEEQSVREIHKKLAISGEPKWAWLDNQSLPISAIMWHLAARFECGRQYRVQIMLDVQYRRH